MHKKQSVLLILLFILFVFFNRLNAQVELKNLRVYANDDEKSPPVLVNTEGQGDVLNIEFDVKSDSEPSLKIIFKFCDRDWYPYDNIFLKNFGHDVVHPSELFYSSTEVTVKEADYSFSGFFPNSRSTVEFPYSGKWKFYITDGFDESEIYAEGKFIVVHAPMDISADLTKTTLEGKIYYPADLGKVFNITTNFTLPEGMPVFDVIGVEIIENFKLDFPFVIDKSGNDELHQYYYDGNRSFTFTSKEVRPGNEYRQTNLRDHKKFIAPNVNAQLDGLETSRFYMEGKNDLNGGSRIVDGPYGTYLNVLFRIRVPDEINKKIFLVGAFTNWEVLPEFEMDNNNGLFSKTVQLRRGVYDYQYVTGEIENGYVTNIDWYVLEGNTWSTSNNYYVFIWYKDTDKGGYDKIIGFKKIVSK